MSEVKRWSIVPYDQYSVDERTSRNGEWVKWEDYEALADKVDALVEALTECEAEIDQYIRQEYPGDHPVHARYRARDFAANPARAALAALKGGCQ